MIIDLFVSVDDSQRWVKGVVMVLPSPSSFENGFPNHTLFGSGSLENGVSNIETS